MAQSVYEEIDINGNVGKPGQVKSYEVTMFTEQAEAEAEEKGRGRNRIYHFSPHDV